MKKLYLKKMMLAAVVLMAGMGLNAQSTICKSPIGSGNTAAYISWATDASGNVVITISGVDGDRGTSFRSNGMQFAQFYIDESATANASDYFTQPSNVNGGNVYTLTLKNGVTIPQGTVITYGVSQNAGRTVEWRTTNNSNAAGSYFFTYTYGSSCTQLDTPVITSLAADGTIDFTPVTNAENHMVHVYKGTLLVHSQLILSGEKINFESFTNSTYTVKLQALAAVGSIDSELSAGESWVLTAVSPVGKSEYCDYNLKTNANENALLSINTINGNVVISLAESGSNGTPTFRGGNGMNFNNFYVNGLAASNFFDKNPSNADKSPTITLVKKEAVSIDLGDKITYSGEIEWYNGTTGRNQQHNLSYTYGTTCGEWLETPAITSISADSIITFNAITNANLYLVQIFRGASLVHEQTITASGDKITGFTPLVTDTYLVKMKAKNSEGGYLDSDFSEDYEWYVEVGDIVLSKSEYCGYDLKPNDSNVANKALISWNTINGDVVITISEYGENANTIFRGTAFEQATNTSTGFKVNGSPAIGSIFDIQYVTGSKEYVLKLRDGAEIQLGDKITYNQQVAWSVGEQGKNEPHNFSYTYGTTCGELLETPEITGIDQDGVITFSSIEDAAGYMVCVYNAAGNEVYRQAVTESGATVDFISYIDATYTVKIKALADEEADGILDSAMSEGVNWTLTAQPLPDSEICNVLINNNNDEASYAYLSWNTTEAGDIIVSISAYGDEETIFDSNAMDRPTVMNDFECKYNQNEPAAITVFQRKSTATINIGDKISYIGNIKWKVGTRTYNRQQVLPTYTYGSTCNTGPGTFVSNPVENNILFYPNPATDMVNFTEKVKEVSLYSPQGQLIVLQQNVEKLNVSAFAKGMYVLQITDYAGNKTTGKIEIR